MTTFLTLFVLSLFAISLWQISKIYSLSRVGSDDNPGVANDKDNKLNGKLMLAYVVFLFVFTIAGFFWWGDVLLPESASEHGAKTDMLMTVSFILIFFVFFVTEWVLFYFAYKYYGRKNQRAVFFADNDKLEMVWTIIPAIVLSGLIIYGLSTWSDIMNINVDDDPIVIELYAKQFNWDARYAGNDNTLGEANVRLIEGVNTLGVDASDPNAQDDIVTTELHLPVGKKILFKMRSQDVLHSAYMPHFRAQMNTVPGMITQFAFTPTITTEEMRENLDVIAKVKNINAIRKANSKILIAKGEVPLEPYEFDYLLLCNKICGASHYNMQMKIIVESEEDYLIWLSTQKTIAETLK